jgi:hypothetical protein
MILSGWRELGLFNPDEAVKEISREITYRRYRRSMEVIDRIMDRMNVDEYPVRCLTMVLIATAAIANDLHRREDFKDQVLGRLRREKGEAFAKSMLQGL